MIYNGEAQDVTEDFVMLIEDCVRVYQLTTFQMPLMVLLNTRHKVVIV